MHFGVVVADVPSERLIAALDAVAPRFADRGPLEALEDLDTSGENEWELAAGDLDGRSCTLGRCRGGRARATPRRAPACPRNGTPDHLAGARRLRARQEAVVAVLVRMNMRPQNAPDE